VPVLATDWGYWLKQYPGAVAYNMYDRYKAIDKPLVRSKEAASTRPAPDPRLDAESLVVAVEWKGVVRAYPLPELAAKKLIRDMISDTEVVVLWFEQTKTAAIYETVMEGADNQQLLTLEHNPQLSHAPFMDKETFSHWTIEGRALDGPLKNKTLRPLPFVQCKWWAWAAEHPQSEIYDPTRKVEFKRRAPGKAQYIKGERLDWDSLAKTRASVVAHTAESITLRRENSEAAHQVRITPHTEFYSGGKMVTEASWRPGQNVWILATRDEKKNWQTLLSIADEESMRVMSAANEPDSWHEVAPLRAQGDVRMFGTVLDRTNNNLTLLIRRSDSYQARLLKQRAKIFVHEKEKIPAQITSLEPDYSRMRLGIALSRTNCDVQVGDVLQITAKQVKNKPSELPPDLGRFKERQARIDYFLSTIYCACGMMGDSCAGHWNTLAACKIHGCGMPNVVTSLVEKSISEGRSDKEILQQLIAEHGKIILRQHHYWGPQEPSKLARP